MQKTLSDYTIQEFPVEPSPEEWAAFHAFRRARHLETRPDDPMWPDDMVEKLWLVQDEFEVERRLNVHRDGFVIGSMDFAWDLPNAPGYATNKQFFFCGGHVLKPYRRRGIGTALASEVARLMEESDTTIWNTGAEEQDGYAFLNWLGAEAKSEGAENRLDLREVDWDMVDRWVAEGRERNPETKLHFFKHRVPDDWLPAYCPAISDMLNTMPFDDLEHGEIVVTPESMKKQLYEGWLDTAGGSHHTYLTQEPDGTISGITDINYMPSRADRVSQMFTGVQPDHRGRGLGKWLKAAMLQYIRETYPGANWVITGNANSNDPMLGINKKLGFKTHRGGTGYQMGRDQLVSRLAEIASE